jgi:NADPH:quinone reductase-like Zn-dependent oxidoreductase
VLITACRWRARYSAVQMARALEAIVVATVTRPDHKLVHRQGAAVVVDQNAAN